MPNTQTLSVKEIITKVKNEVNRKNKHIVQKTVMQNINTNSNKHIIQDKYYPFKKKEQYHYSDFTMYDDIEFIQNIYQGILNRKADEKGLQYYLHLLRSGKKTKIEIIFLISTSKEGKEKNTSIIHSRKRYFYTKLSSLPFLGYFIKLGILIVKLPKLQEQLNRYENLLSQETTLCIKNDKLLEKELNHTTQTVGRIKNILMDIEKGL